MTVHAVNTNFILICHDLNCTRKQYSTKIKTDDNYKDSQPSLIQSSSEFLTEDTQKFFFKL